MLDIITKQVEYINFGVEMIIDGRVLSFTELGLNQFKIPSYLSEKLIANGDFETPEDASLAFEELKKYLWLGKVSGLNNNSLPMFSKEVDSAWHQFILFTREYTQFCNSFFGEYIHHAPEIKSTIKRTEKPKSSKGIKNLSENLNLMLDASNDVVENREEIYYFKNLFEEYFGDVHEIWGLSNSRFDTSRKVADVKKIQRIAGAITISLFIQNPVAASDLKPIFLAETLVQAGVSSVPKSGAFTMPSAFTDEIIDSSRVDGIGIEIIKLNKDLIKVQLRGGPGETNLTKKSRATYFKESLKSYSVDPIGQCETPSGAEAPGTIKPSPRFGGMMLRNCKLDPVEQCDTPSGFQAPDTIKAINEVMLNSYHESAE